MADRLEVIIYVDGSGNRPFAGWMEDLDGKTVTRIERRLDVSEKKLRRRRVGR